MEGEKIAISRRRWQKGKNYFRLNAQKEINYITIVVYQHKQAKHCKLIKYKLYTHTHTYL